MNEELAMRIEAQAALVDRLDQRGELDRIAEEVRALTPDGMDLEAQGEIADQLTAAQAANERVRALADDPSAWAYTDGPSAAEIYRALDGDTTEEA